MHVCYTLSFGRCLVTDPSSLLRHMPLGKSPIRYILIANADYEIMQVTSKFPGTTRSQETNADARNVEQRGESPIACSRATEPGRHTGLLKNKCFEVVDPTWTTQ